MLGAAPLKVRQWKLSDVELVAQVPCSLQYGTIVLHLYLSDIDFSASSRFLEGQLQNRTNGDICHAQIILPVEGTGNDLPSVLKGQEILQHTVSPDFQIQGRCENTLCFNEAVVTGIVSALRKLRFG